MPKVVKITVPKLCPRSDLPHVHCLGIQLNAHTQNLTDLSPSRKQMPQFDAPLFSSETAARSAQASASLNLLPDPMTEGRVLQEDTQRGRVQTTPMLSLPKQIPVVQKFDEPMLPHSDARMALPVSLATPLKFGAVAPDEGEEWKIQLASVGDTGFKSSWSSGEGWSIDGKGGIKTVRTCKF